MKSLFIIACRKVFNFYLSSLTSLPSRPLVAPSVQKKMSESKSRQQLVVQLGLRWTEQFSKLMPTLNACLPALSLCVQTYIRILPPPTKKIKEKRKKLKLSINRNPQKSLDLFLMLTHTNTLPYTYLLHAYIGW